MTGHSFKIDFLKEFFITCDLMMLISVLESGSKIL